jgi:type I restriction enzyme S subunit
VELSCLIQLGFFRSLLGDGSTFKELAKESLESVLLLEPPPEEQRAISSFLDRETAKIDALVVKKERLIELLREKRAALITHAVTKGLDPTVPMKDSHVEWLPQISAHWEVKRNGNLFRERDQRGFPELPLLNVSISTGVSLREFSTERIETKS